MQFQPTNRRSTKLVGGVSLIIVLLCLSIVSAACGKKEDKEASLTPVTVQMNWVHEYSAATFYMAEKGGHFKDAGLQVTLNEGGFAEDGSFINGISKLKAGEAQFATTSLDGALQANAEGTPVVMIMAITQRSPFTLISNSEDNIQRPQDLEGKTVALNEDVTRLVVTNLLKSSDVDPSTVTFVPRESFGIEPLVSGQVDAMGGWIINEGYLYKQAGYTPNFILPSDYGFNTYDFLIVTTPDMIKNQPKVVEEFVRAMYEGLQDVVANPDAAAEAVLSYDNTLDVEQQKAQMQIFLPLINPTGVTLGSIDPEIIQFNYQLLLDNELVTPIEVDKTYDITFINAVTKQ